MDFPHIKDTKFPNVQNVDVYKFQNNFDYARWQGKVSIKLLNVLWNSNYADVPGFTTDAIRDNWFDEQPGLIRTLESAFNITPDDKVRIPVPYNDAYRFNYLMVDMPIQTSAEKPIDYENGNTRVQRWYYFIDSMEQLAPNTTELKITLDVWTTFSHTVEIPYLMLERGHAPMMEISVDEFLANPIANNEYLLAEDFNYGDDTIIKTSNYVPVGNGTKYVLFVAPLKASDFPVGGTTFSGNSTPPRYTSTVDRWGNLIVVNDYEWKYGNVDYSNAPLPIYNQIQDGILSGCNCFAIEGSQAYNFFNYCAKNCVNLIHAIQAMFILDENLFTRGSSFTAFGYTLYTASRKISQNNITLNKNAFGFDSKYSEITKLYTSPYSFIEFTDDNGNTFSAKVENCGKLKMNTEVSLIYPYLDYNIFFSGVNGDGTMQYTWKEVNGNTVSKTMWASDFSKFMMNWSIPTYALYVSQEYDFASNKFFDMLARRNGAIVNYENAVRYGNTNRENTADTFTTRTANTNRVQSGLVSNMEDTNDTQDTIVDELQNGGSFGSQAAAGNGYISNTAWANFEKVADDCDTDWLVIEQGFGVTRDYQVGMACLNIGASLAGASVSSGGEGLGIPSTDSGMTANVPIVNAIVGGITTGASTSMMITNEQSMKNIQQQAIQAKVSHARTQTEKLHDIQKYYGHNVKEENNDLRELIVTRFSDVNGINNTNATATQDTETANATYTRNAVQAAEDGILRQKQLEVQNLYLNARLHTPSVYSQYSGDMQPDAFERRGVRMNIRTQNKAAIAQAGDAMLRYGYALHRIWDMSNGFHYGKHFTFWKAEDIWINEGSGLAGNAVNIIGDILKKGVTIWRNADEIGKVSIYDNI